jgi:hypothetical protein
MTGADCADIMSFLHARGKDLYLFAGRPEPGERTGNKPALLLQIFAVLNKEAVAVVQRPHCKIL